MNNAQSVPTRPPLSVVIPTFNGQHLLEKNLPAVLACLSPGDELVIVDDASTDQTINWLRQTYGINRVTKPDQGEAPPAETYALAPPHKADIPYKVFQSPYLLWRSEVPFPVAITLWVIQNRANIRFGASVNRGVVQASHPYIFLLNNDVSPEADVVSHLMPHFSDPKVFAVGCLEIEEHAGGIEGGKNTLWFERGMFIHSRASNFSSGPTAWASGGSSMFDREKWLSLGGFDLDYYPAYWEDVDISFRARKRGWQVLFERLAVVHHNHETTNTSVFGKRRISDMSWINARKFVVKHADLVQLLQHWMWQPYWLWQQRRLKRVS